VDDAVTVTASCSVNLPFARTRSKSSPQVVSLKER